MTRVALLAILLLLVAWGFWRLMDGVIEALGGTTRTRARRRSQETPVKLVRDPVCGTWVSPGDARSIGSGPTARYFCSEECRRKFQQGA